MWRWPSEADWREEWVRGRGCLPWRSKRRKIRLRLVTEVKSCSQTTQRHSAQWRLYEGPPLIPNGITGFLSQICTKKKRDVGCNGDGAALNILSNCSNRVTLSDRHEIYLSLGHFAGKSKEEKSGLFQMYLGNKSLLMFFSNPGCSAEQKKWFLFSAFTQLSYLHSIHSC